MNKKPKEQYDSFMWGYLAPHLIRQEETWGVPLIIEITVRHTVLQPLARFFHSFQAIENIEGQLYTLEDDE